MLHSDFVCAAGQEISKAWTSIFFCFQPVSHNLKGAKGSYLYSIQLNRPISPPSAAALSFALIYSWLFWFAYGLLTVPPPKKSTNWSLWDLLPSGTIAYQFDCETKSTIFIQNCKGKYLFTRAIILSQKSLFPVANVSVTVHCGTKDLSVFDVK